MKKILLFILVLVISISLVISFSLIGCKKITTVETTAVDATASTAASETTAAATTVKEQIPGVDRPIRILWVSYGMSLVGQQEMEAGANIKRDDVKFHPLDS